MGTQWRVNCAVSALANVKTTEYKATVSLVGVSMNVTIRNGESVTLLARIYDAYDNDVPLLNDGANVLSVKYTVEKAASFFPGSSLADSSVVGHTDVDAGTQCVLEAPETSDAWPDEPGYTFALTPENTVNPVFPTPGTYTIRVKITLRDANPVVFSETIRVE
ncbi:MAG: hypothetical protein IKU86_03270 [Thermoguttaceae bacterium]|nr:hypothetical protein [Thermoguttaceae bacterium]